MKPSVIFLAGVALGALAYDLLAESVLKKLFTEGLELDVDVALGRDSSWDADAHH